MPKSRQVIVNGSTDTKPVIIEQGQLNPPDSDWAVYVYSYDPKTVKGIYTYPHFVVKLVDSTACAYRIPDIRQWAHTKELNRLFGDPLPEECEKAVTIWLDQKSELCDLITNMDGARGAWAVYNPTVQK
jgi:hypothetical protein